MMKKVVDFFRNIIAPEHEVFVVDVSMKMIYFQKDWMTNLYKSLYVSEGWYELWKHNQDTSYGLYCKTTALVLFDRHLNEENSRIESRLNKIRGLNYVENNLQT